MKPFDYLLYAVVVFGWSTSWLPLKYQLGVVAPEVSLFWRFGFAAMLMFIVTRVSGYRLGFAWRDHLRFMALGLCLFSTNFALFYYGGIYAASGLLAVVFSTASLVNVIMIAVISRTAPRPLHLVAAVVGLGGVALIYWPEMNSGVFALLSLSLCFGGTLFFCTGNMVSASTQRAGISVWSANSWGMLYGTIILGVVSLVRGHPFIMEFTPVYIGGLIWLVVISSVLTFTSYLMLLGRIGAGKAGYATVVFPVFALLLSTMFESYTWSSFAFVGMALVVAGNVIMVRVR
ncbi:DMT family transporter [Alphaproteobacteria bacterium]|nr:DMT family transporter [Alphaproteobacteria bacterium]